MIIPPILCVTGSSGSGKTHLLERLIPLLEGHDLRVAAIKHCQHLDQGPPDKDSSRLVQAGAEPTIAVGKDGIGVQGLGWEPPLMDLVANFCRNCDLVLVEGYSTSIHDKIMLSTKDKPDNRCDAKTVKLLVGSKEPDGIDRDNIQAIADWTLGWFSRRMALRKGLIGAVLTGGTSRRMGSDKSRMSLAGRSVLGQLCELLADRLGQIVIVGKEGEELDVPLYVRFQPDIIKNLGPLGGIATALRLAGVDAPPKAVCILACDMPLIGGNLLNFLLAGRDPSSAATAAVNPNTGRVEPLVAIYEPRARESIETALDSGRLSATRWLKSAAAHLLTVPSELADELANVNTPQELEAIRSRPQKIKQ